MNNITKIEWNLSDYCKSECSYCPTSLRGGPEPRGLDEYLKVTKTIVESYSKIGKRLEWTFNGGEPLDLDVVPILKYCKENGGSITLHTNGGRLWVDWWALVKYVDNLILTYHYWQNPALIKYILDTFVEKQKNFTVNVPIRPDYFDEDISRALQIESEYKIIVSKNALFKNARPDDSMYNYTEEQLDIMTGAKYLKEIKYKHETTTFMERHLQKYVSNPVYAGKICNVGIERLYISHTGFVQGARCNNQPLGLIWNENWYPPLMPQVCSMQACVHPDDQLITKFP